jgi:hypothetical protein
MQIKSVNVNPDEEDEVALPKSRERDDDQKGIDSDAEKMKAAWVAAGKPGLDKLTTKAGFKAATKTAYIVNKSDRPTVKGMIRRACTLHKVSPVYAKDLVNADGTVRIKWTVGPVPPKSETPAETPAEVPAEVPAPSNPAADVETPAPQTDAPAETGRRGLIGRR